MHCNKELIFSYCFYCSSRAPSCRNSLPLVWPPLLPCCRCHCPHSTPVTRCPPLPPWLPSCTTCPHHRQTPRQHPPHRRQRPARSRHRHRCHRHRICSSCTVCIVCFGGTQAGVRLDEEGGKGGVWRNCTLK